MVDNSVLYKSQQGYALMKARHEDNLRRWRVPYESRIVSTLHGETHVLVTGAVDAPPLFLFHGWSGNHSNACTEWNLPHLAQCFRIYLPETIGQSGRSAPTRLKTTGTGYAEWILDVFDALKIEQANVSGISGGGYLSLKFASYAPDRVKKVLAFSTAGIVTMGTLRFIIKAVPFLLYPTEAGARRFVQATSAPDVDSEFIELAAQEFYTIFKHFQVLKEGPARLTNDELRKISAPVRIVMGQHEITCSVPKLLARANAMLRNVETYVAPNAGHMIAGDIASDEILKFFLAERIPA